MQRYFIIVILLFFFRFSYSQIKWQNVDSLYQPLPSSAHVYFTNEKLDTAAFRAYYIIADLKDNQLNFTTDTTYKRRLTPSQFYQKNDSPLVVVNGTFFSFETNQNLNVVIKDGKMVSYTAPIKGRGKDSLNLIYPLKGVMGISKKREADVAWLLTDSSMKYPVGYQFPVKAFESDYRKRIKPYWVFSFNDSIYNFDKRQHKQLINYKWKMQTAIGGGPVLLQNGEIMITNDEERMFGGKAINDKHPRTAMGYTKDNKLIILVIEGRNSNASGASLIQEAQIFKDLGCVEALNLDGGGSSCLLINGKETIEVSDKKQRPVPAVFIIRLN